MTKEEERQYIISAANMSTVYADIVSSKTLDFLALCEKKKVRHEVKRAVGFLKKQRRLLEAFLSKVVEKRERFADVAGGLEDAAEHEFMLLHYSTANVVGRVKNIDHELVTKGTELYLLCEIVATGFAVANKTLATLKYVRAKKLTANIDGVQKAVVGVLDLLVKNRDKNIDIDNNVPVVNSVKLLTRKLIDSGVLNGIFNSLDE